MDCVFCAARRFFRRRSFRTSRRRSPHATAASILSVLFLRSSRSSALIFWYFASFRIQCRVPKNLRRAPVSRPAGAGAAARFVSAKKSRVPAAASPRTPPRKIRAANALLAHQPLRLEQRIEQVREPPIDGEELVVLQLAVV